MKVRILLLLLACTVVCASCSLPFFKPKTGALKVTLYSESLAEVASAAGFTDVTKYIDLNGLEQYSLLLVEGKESTLYIGDKTGIVSVPELPVGTYTIRPAFLDEALAISVDIAANKTTEQTIIMPIRGIYGISLLESFQSSALRRGLSTALKRQELLTEIGDSRAPALSLLSADFFGDGLLTDIPVSENFAAANQLAPATPFSFSYSVNNVAAHTTIGNILKRQWEALGWVDTVTVDGTYSWDTFMQKVGAGDFQAFRIGWKFDSNNPYAYYKTIFKNSGSDNQEIRNLFSALEMKHGGDNEGYIELLQALHDALDALSVFIPIYHYE